MFRKIIVLVLLCLPCSPQVFADTMIPKIDFVDASVIDVVQALCSQADLDLVASGDMNPQKRATIHLTNISAEDAINYILRTNGFTYEKKGNSLLVSTLPQDISQSGYKKESLTYELKNISAEKVAAILNKIMPDVLVISGERANKVVLRGKDSDIGEIRSLIEKIDKPIPQILIEAQIVEVLKSDSIRLGVDYNGGVFKFVNTKHDDIKTTINALLASGSANVIASPRIATLDNHEALINIGDRIPYAVPVTSSGGSTQWTVDYIDAGVKLKITPQIGKDNQIITTLQPEVSAISEWRMTSAGEFPVISTRNASATLRTKSGETIVVGGLESQAERVNTSRTPILGQFPILNLFFQNRTYEKVKTEIMFLVTPYII